MSVSLSQIFLLLINEESSGPCSLLLWGSGQLYPLLPETWGLTRAGLFSRACYSPLQTASELFPLRPSLCATSTVSDIIICSHISLLGLLQIFLSLHWLCLFLPYPFSISSSLDPSLVSWSLFKSYLLPATILDYPTQTFFPRTFKTIRFFWTAPLATLFSNYFHDYLINSKELYKGQLQRLFAIFSF